MNQDDRLFPTKVETAQACVKATEKVKANKGGKRLKRTHLLSLVSLLLICGILETYSHFVAYANPIFFKPLFMSSEVINATICPINGVWCAEVNGVYSFYQLPPFDHPVEMYFPVPPHADNILVALNDTSVDWTYSDQNYSTVIGDFPMINWTISPLQDTFNVSVYYSHPVPEIDGNYTFLYTMGTGRYAQEKVNTTAYLSVGIAPKEQITQLNVYTTGPNATTGGWVWKQAEHSVSEENETMKIAFAAWTVSGFVNDFVIIYSTGIATSKPGDINLDGVVDIRDLDLAAKAFGSYRGGDPRWNYAADLNRDGKVDIVDLVIIAMKLTH